MRIFPYGMAAILCAATAALWPAPAQAQEAPAAKSLRREIDPVVVSGDPVKPLWGRKISSLRLQVRRDGAWAAIPFQIDKVDGDGDYFIATSTIPQEIRDETGFEDVPEEKKRARRIKKFEGERKKLERQVEEGKLTQAELDDRRRNAYFEEDLEKLDYNDEVVFMGRDAGDQASWDTWPSPDGVELEITDPLDGGRAWAYLFFFASSPPPLSKDDYITYHPERDFIVTRLSEIDFNDENPMLVESIVGKPPGSPVIPNVLDRFKMRIRIRPIGLFCASLNFDENNARAFTIGYKDGPVRLLRRNIFWIVIAGVRLPFAPKIVMYFKFYENGLAASSDLYVPFNPKYFVCEGSRFTAGLDFRKNTYGARVFTKDNKDLVIDGKMSPAEIDRVKPNQDWIAGYLPSRAALMSRMIYDPEMVRHGAKMDFHFLDDGELEDKPEHEPGQHVIGYTIDVKNFPKGKYYVGFSIYTAYDFEPEQVQELLNVDDNPLKVTGRPGGSN
ncbi:MAG: hypothetical protein KIT79_05965 [Deltaproteobacteria bacterium]|nr:hypothetical protein [Deltaproteobacteria bacterium]